MQHRNNLGFGCVSLTMHAGLKSAADLLSCAYDEGITHFDTAPLYGNGYSEKILGRFIKKSRQKVTITTKCGLGNMNQPSLNIHAALLLNAIKHRIRKKAVDNTISKPSLLSYRVIDEHYVKASLEKSLKNLCTDRIDYYMLHEAIPSFLTIEAHSYLNKKVKEGVIGDLGIAASYVNLDGIEAKDIPAFNVLQYENGPAFQSDHLLNKFSDKKHFYHSTLRSIPFMDKKYSSADWAGILLNRAVKFNPGGKILFSTTSQRRLKNNMDAFEKYNDHSLQNLDNIIDGVH
jgi:diketogulonate reductase-like aldo/keto reductase